MDEKISELDPNQRVYAMKVIEKAKEMGIDPRLALSVAFAESSLNPAAKGNAGEIGIMQVMPKTAEEMGFTVEDLNNPDKNIEVGLTYLKKNLDTYKNPMAAVAGYNAGINHPFFGDPKNNDLPESTVSYVNKIKSLGGFDAKPKAPKEKPPKPGGISADEALALAKQEADYLRAQEESKQAMEDKARIATNLAGAGAGAAVAPILAGTVTATKGLGALPSLARTMQQMSQAPGGMPPGAPPAAPSMTPPVGPVGGPPGGPVGGPVGGPASPMRPPLGGTGTQNYAKAFGLTDIEAGRAVDMSTQPGGAQNMMRQRSEALQKIRGMFPGESYIENPRYGGIMTPDSGARPAPRGGLPSNRGVFVQQPGGAPGTSPTMRQLPPRAPIPNQPLPAPKPSALEQANKLTQGVGRMTGNFLRNPVVSGGLGGLSMASSGQEAADRYTKGDMTGVAIAGVGAFGGGLQMLPNPIAKSLGYGLSAASPLTMYLYDKMKSGGFEKPRPESMTEQRQLQEMMVAP